MVKATAIDPSVVDADGVYRKEGPARVFVSEKDAMAAIKTGPHQGRRRAGAGRHRSDGHGHGGNLSGHRRAETSALRQTRRAADRRAVLRRLHRRVHRPHRPGRAGGGPIGKVLDGDLIRIHIDRNRLEGSIDLVGEGERRFTPEEGARILAQRPLRTDLARIPPCPTTRGCGRRCNRPAAGPGRVAFMIRSESLRRWRRRAASDGSSGVAGCCR